MRAPNKIEVTSWIKQGKFTTNTEIIKDFCKAHDDCLLHITLHKKRNKRSNKQLGYYFAVIITIFQNCIKNEWGEIWTKEECHNFLLNNFNYEELIDEETGLILRKVKRTRDNNTVQQEEYYAKCRAFLKEYFEVDVPLPNQEMKISFD